MWNDYFCNAHGQKFHTAVDRNTELFLLYFEFSTFSVSNGKNPFKFVALEAEKHSAMKGLNVFFLVALTLSEVIEFYPKRTEY